MKKEVKSRCGLIVAAIILIFALVLGFGAIECEGGKTAAFAESRSMARNTTDTSDGIYINSDEDTGYYFFMPMTDFKLYLSKDYFKNTTIFGSAYANFLVSIGAYTFDRSTTGATFILKFNDVKYYREGTADINNGAPLLSFVNSYLEIPSSFWSGTEFVIKGSENAGQHAKNKTDLKINMNKEYFEYLKKFDGNFGNITLSIKSPDGFAYPFMTKDGDKNSISISSSNFYMVQGKKDSDDGLLDNGGVDVGGGKGDVKTWFDNVLEWFNGLDMTWKVIIIVVLCLIGLGFISWLLRLIFGKR